MTTTMNANVNAAIRNYENSQRVIPGETTEEWTERMDGAFNQVKAEFANIFHIMGNVFGYTRLRDDIIQILEASMKGEATEGSLKKASKKVQELTKEHIDFIMEYGNEDSIKKALAFKELIENGDRNIFEALISGIIYVSKKVNKKLRKIFKIEDDTTLLQACCNGFIALIGKLREGFTWAAGHVKNILSLLVAGSIKLGSLIVSTIKYGFGLLAAKCKSVWNNWKAKRFESELDEFEDDFDDEDLDVAIDEMMGNIQS